MLPTRFSLPRAGSPRAPRLHLRARLVLWLGGAGILAGFFAAGAARGQTFDIGLTQLRARDPSLIGTGVAVSQVEAPNTKNGTDFEVSPSVAGQPVGLFTYYSSTAPGGATGAPTNAAGSESGHADSVGSILFGNNNGTENGVAPGVSHVNNLEANFFFSAIQNTATTLGTPIVNQSFSFGAVPVATQQAIDQIYDNYAAVHGTLFISAVDNGGGVHAPGTAYNSIGVGDYQGSSSTGPTPDNGRSKPDIVALNGETSFATPQVSGAAAILLQAGARGDGGGTAANKSAATNSLTVKALLLTGASKPNDWTHTATAPLDTRYGAGVLNVNTSDLILDGGQHAAGVTTALAPLMGKAAQLAPAGTYAVEPTQGFNLSTLTNPAGQDVADHYFFSLSGGGGAGLTLTSTLAWNRQNGQTGINDLDLYLLNPNTGAQYAASISTVDNVEHLYATNLTPGAYDLEVVKNYTGEVSAGETYALAFNVVPEPGTGWLVLLAVGGLVVGRFAARRGGKHGKKASLRS